MRKNLPVSIISPDLNTPNMRNGKTYCFSSLVKLVKAFDISLGEFFSGGFNK